MIGTVLMIFVGLTLTGLSDQYTYSPADDGTMSIDIHVRCLHCDVTWRDAKHGAFIIMFSYTRTPAHPRARAHTKVKKATYIAQYPVLGTIQSALHFTSLTDLFTQTTISASRGSIQPYATINVRRLLVYISTTVYSQLLIYTAEWTGAM